MPYIKAQKVIRDTSGQIISGTAAIIDSEYIAGSKGHSKKHVREKLGKVLYLSEDKKTGIFLSPTRGMVEYCSLSDTFQEIECSDSRLQGNQNFPEPKVHSIFGDVYLLLEFMEKVGLTAVFREVFTKKSLFEKVMVHTLHHVLAVGSHISCDDFLTCSFASYLFPDLPLAELHCDSSYYEQMGDDDLRIKFFRAFIKLMKHSTDYIDQYAEFGKGCYVDSTPLPNEIRSLMSNAFCSHGTEGNCLQTRMYLVLDDKSDLPVWYGLTPGNVLDLSTINTIASDTFISVGIEISSMVLDAGYITKDFLSHYSQDDEKTFIGKSPQKRGFEFKTRYHEVKNLIPNMKYEIIRNGKSYFSFKKKVVLFGNPVWSYIYVDQKNALDWHVDYVLQHPEEYKAMTDKDKNWNRVKNGFFILLSNIDTSCSEILDRYIERTDIESVFKSSKDYGSLLPINKWDKKRVDGKLFSDIITTIVVLLLRKKLIKGKFSLAQFVGKPRSLMCFKDNNGHVVIETPNKQVKEIYNLFGIPIPASLNLQAYSKRIYGPTFR